MSPTKSLHGWPSTVCFQGQRLLRLYRIFLLANSIAGIAKSQPNCFLRYVGARLLLVDNVGSGSEPTFSAQCGDVAYALVSARKADLAHFAFVPEEDIAVAQSERAADVSSQVE